MSIFNDFITDIKETTIDDRFKLRFCMLNIFDSSYTHILPDKYSIEFDETDTPYDICNAIYKQVEYLYNTYGIYVIPFPNISKSCLIWKNIHTISLYKMYSILKGCDIYDIDIPIVSYCIKYDHTNTSNMCIKNIYMSCSKDRNYYSNDDYKSSKLYRLDLSLDNISDSNKAIIYAIIYGLSKYENILNYDYNVSPTILKGTDIENEFEAQFYTKYSCNSPCIEFLEEAFRFDIADIPKYSGYDRIKTAIALRNKYNKRIFLPNDYISNELIDIPLLKSLLLDYLDVDYEIRDIVLQNEFEYITFAYSYDSTIFGFYTNSILKGICVIDNNGDNRYVVFDDMKLTDYQRLAISVVHDLMGGINLVIPENEFDKFIFGQ